MMYALSVFEVSAFLGGSAQFPSARKLSENIAIFVAPEQNSGRDYVITISVGMCVCVWGCVCGGGGVCAVCVCVCEGCMCLFCVKRLTFGHIFHML